MTQPDIIDWDEFPDRQVSELQELTGAIRDLAAAIRGSNRQQDIDISLEANAPLGDVEDRIARYNAIRDREEKTLGPEFQEEAESPEAPLRDWEKDLLYSLDELPDGAYVDLDPPRALPRAVALKVDIDEDPEIMVHRVVKGEWADDLGWTLGGWHAWSGGDDPEADTPWEFDAEQVEALGLSYSDFTLPTVPRPEPESDPVKRPAHYQMGGRECIEFTRYMDFCWGNVVKYLWRAPHKGNLAQDIDKALEYLELADPSKRPLRVPEGREDPFRFFYEFSLDVPGGSVEEAQLDALAAVFNHWISIGGVRNRIKGVRDRYQSEEG